MNGNIELIEVINMGTSGQLGHWFGLFDRPGAKAAGESKVQKSPSVESRSLAQNLLEGAVRSD